MLKLLKNFTKKDWLIVAISLLLIIFQVWLDLKLPDISGIDIINYIEGNNLSQYYASIIVLTNEIDLLNQVINKKSVFTYSSKIDNINSFIDTLTDKLPKISLISTYSPEFINNRPIYEVFCFRLQRSRWFSAG